MKWRIRTDEFAGFHVQAKRSWSPFWQLPPGGVCNTFRTLEEAERFIARQVYKREFRARTVKEFDA